MRKKSWIKMISLCTAVAFAWNTFLIAAAVQSPISGNEYSLELASSSVGSWDKIIFTTHSNYTISDQTRSTTAKTANTDLGLDSAYEIEELFVPEVSIDDDGTDKVNIYAVNLIEQTRSEATDVLVQLRAQPSVLSCEFNYVVTADAVTPNDTYYSNQYAHALCDADMAWTYSTGSNAVAVAVLDTGVNITHADLANNIWRKPGEIAGNGIDDDLNGYVDDYNGWNFIDNTNVVTDDNGHGTHVAGIIGSIGNNGRGVAGVCWQVKILPIKVLNSAGKGTTASVIQGIKYATSLNVPIINCSLGYSRNSDALKTAIEEYDGLFIAAAGNDAQNTDSAKHYPSSFDCDNIISVANTTSSDVLSATSNYGVTTVDIAAPGNAIYSTAYTGGYVYKSGTSMAAPYVAGAAALIKSLNSLASTGDIKNAILTKADDVAALSGKVATGGRINVMESLRFFVLLGDVNQDGVLSVSDITDLRSHISSPYLTGNALIAADVDCDGTVTVADVVALRALIVG